MTAPLTLETPGLLAHLRDWLDHYPENIFAPPPTFTDPREQLLSTVVAAHMGRHVLTRLIADIENGHPRLVERCAPEPSVNTATGCECGLAIIWHTRYAGSCTACGSIWTREPTPSSGPRDPRPPASPELEARVAAAVEAKRSPRTKVGPRVNVAPSTARVAADARMPEARREPPTHPPGEHEEASEPSGGAPTGPGWTGVWLRKVTGFPFDYEPVVVQDRVGYGLRWYNPRSDSWHDPNREQWGGTCIRGSAKDKVKLDKLTRALELILADEELAADPAKTCGPRRGEAEVRARRLRAAFDNAKSDAPEN